MGTIRTPAGSSISWERIHLALPDGLLLGALVFLCIWLFRFRRCFSYKRNMWLCLLFLYCGAVAALTLRITLPAGWRVTAENTNYALESVRWIPFESAASIFRNSLALGTMKYFIRIIGGNFVMLLPLGILIPLIWPNVHAGKMVIISVLVPIGIESFQLIDNILGGVIRAVEVEDLILNTGGCFLGYLIFVIFKKINKKEKRGQKSKINRERAG